MILYCNTAVVKISLHICKRYFSLVRSREDRRGTGESKQLENSDIEPQTMAERSTYSQKSLVLGKLTNK